MIDAIFNIFLPSKVKPSCTYALAFALDFF